MTTAYFECKSGISGDMTIGALLDLGLPFNYLKKELKKLNLKSYKLTVKKVIKKGIKATKFDVIVAEHHHERHLSEINKIIDKSKLSKDVKRLSKKIFITLGKAESKFHKVPLNHIHFHEVGAVDAIIDIVGTCIGLKKLGIKQIYSSPLHVGKGYVEFSHGKMKIPAPATELILKQRNAPYYSKGIEGELVTPTGAAIICTLAKKFGKNPIKKIKVTGYGAGSLDLQIPNVLKISLGKQILVFYR